MKIAVVTDDGTTIAQHFGRARYYKVFTTENGTITDSELRDRAGTLHHGHGHHHGGQHGHDHEHHHGGHDHAPDRHAGMVAQITDVDALIVGGMGYGARTALDDAGVAVTATALTDADAAVRAFIEGTLEHRGERLH